MKDKVKVYKWLCCISDMKLEKVSTTFIDSDHLRFTVMTNSLAKEAQCGCSVPFGSQQKVDSLTCCIDSPIQILPLAFDFDVAFIHSPLPTCSALVSARSLIQQRRQADNPTTLR
jgi:hypothetical protein